MDSYKPFPSDLWKNNIIYKSFFKIMYIVCQVSLFPFPDLLIS